MGHYYGNIDYVSLLHRMRQHYTRYPLELQLTWLVEMVMIKVFIVLSETTNQLRYNAEEDRYTMYQYTVKMYLQRVGFNISTINLLFSFRNKYVHEGPCAAKNLLSELKMNIHWS